MLSLTKPKLFIPIHGEHRMLKHHRDLAIDCGVKPENILVMDNGDVAAINRDGLRAAGKVQVGEIYIDGTGIGDIGSIVLKERKLLSEEGLFTVIISIDSEKMSMVNGPTVISRGFIYMKGNEAITQSLANEAKEVVMQELKQKTLNELNMKKGVTERLNQKIYEMTLRRPLVIPIVVDLKA